MWIVPHISRSKMPSDVISADSARPSHVSGNPTGDDAAHPKRSGPHPSRHTATSPLPATSKTASRRPKKQLNHQLSLSTSNIVSD